MAKRLLILQFRTDQSLNHEQELFNKIFSNNFDIKYYNLFNDNFKKHNTDDYDGLIISGSGQFDMTLLDDDKLEILEKNSYIIKNFVNEDKPTLGICFGHQLIAKLMDGEVIRDEKQSETGTVEIYLTSEGEDAKIFKNMPKSFFAAQGHKECVGKTPKKAVLLAYSAKTNIQSYQIGNNVFTVQFHPEFKLEDLLFRLQMYPEYMKDKNIEDIKAEHEDIPHAHKVLENFKAIIDAT